MENSRQSLKYPDLKFRAVQIDTVFGAQGKTAEQHGSIIVISSFFI
jgi:hypothetical protein